jgi:hypothetical protein
MAVFVVLATSCGADDLTSAGRGGLFPDLYDPTEEGEPFPSNYRQSLPRDAINPVYDPSFTTPDRIDWPGDELVIGVEIEGEARAYPVGFLTRREMVIDNHRGIPTLVTW